MWQFFLFIAAVSAQSSKSVPLGTPLFGYTGESEACESVWSAGTRYPGMDGEIPNWLNQPYLEVKDFEANRMYIRLQTPYGQIVMVVYPDGSGYESVFGDCFKLQTPGVRAYLNMSRNTLVKTDQLPNHIDVYTGAAREPISGYHLMAKTYWVDSRDGDEILEEWIQDNARPRNSDGSCPQDFKQFHGVIDHRGGGCMPLAEYVSRIGHAAYDALWQPPLGCSSSSPDYTTVMCWG